MISPCIEVARNERWGWGRSWQFSTAHSAFGFIHPAQVELRSRLRQVEGEDGLIDRSLPDQGLEVWGGFECGNAVIAHPKSRRNTNLRVEQTEQFRMGYREESLHSVRRTGRQGFSGLQRDGRESLTEAAAAVSASHAPELLLYLEEDLLVCLKPGN